MENRNKYNKNKINLDAQDVETVIDRGSHEELVACLRVLIEDRDSLLSKQQALNESLSTSQIDLNNLSQVYNDTNKQFNDILNDQSAIEEELSNKQFQIDILSNKLVIAERKENELSKMLKDQVDKFDKDKKNWFELESGLRGKITTLSAKLASNNRSNNKDKDRGESTPPSSPSPASTKTSTPMSPPIIKSMSVESTTEKQAREAALKDAQRIIESEKQKIMAFERNQRNLMDEISNKKVLIEELQSENESYMLLLQERTFSGDLLDSSLFDSAREFDEIPEEDENNNIDENINEEEDDDDEEDFTPKRRRAIRRVPNNRVRQRQQSQQSQQAKSTKPLSEENGNIGVTGPGYDLAAELGRAKLDPNDNREETYESLKVDNKQLRDANKALTTYVSKIIDRIINQEGFEQILATDYKDPEQRESIRLKRSQTTTGNSAGRMSLNGVSDALLKRRSNDNSNNNAATVRARHGHGNRNASNNGNRRSLSIDWSSLFFKNNNNNSAQKLPKQEEDEDDKRERDKIKNQMTKISNESLNDSQYTRFDNNNNNNDNNDIKRSATIGSGALANWRKKRAERNSVIKPDVI